MSSSELKAAFGSGTGCGRPAGKLGQGRIAENRQCLEIALGALIERSGRRRSGLQKLVREPSAQHMRR